MIHYEVTKTVQLALARGLAETTAIPTRCHYADSQISGSGSLAGRRNSILLISTCVLVLLIFGDLLKDIYLSFCEAV